MSEESDITNAQIKTLFSKLTELIMEKCKTRKDVADMIVVVGNWVGLMFSTLIITAEGGDIPRSKILMGRIMTAMSTEMRKHFIILREIAIKSGKIEEKRIIT